MVSLIRETCLVCGIEFAIPEIYRNRLVKCHNTFYCPNGHGQHYIGRTAEEKEIDKLQGQLASIERSRDYYKRKLIKKNKKKRK